MTLALGSCIAACDGQEVPAAPVPSASAAVDTSQPAQQSANIHIYWTAVDESGKNTIREDVITAEQKDALMAARKANAEKAAGDESARNAHVMKTIGSQSWSDCQYYDWILFTSGYNESGSIFCATTDGQNTSPQVIQMPFYPAWVDNSWYHSALLCRTNDCHMETRYCSPHSTGWMLCPPANASSNLNWGDAPPPYIAIDPPTYCE